MKAPSGVKKWRKVNAPSAWHPNRVGDTVEGTFIGRTIKDGSYGQYQILLITVGARTVTISGTVVIQLADAAMLERGDPVKIVFQGHKDLSGDRTMKLFEMYV